MEETYLLKHPGVKKKILAGGTGRMPSFPTGTKLVFNFQTLLDDFERTVIDDSRLAGRPAEIFVGKMFKMEIWEPLLMSMRVGEVAEFWCDATHTGLYPIVSKGMRLIAQGKDPLEGQRHMCGMGNMFNYHSTGYPELDELMRTPQPLIFIMELLQVGDPMSYERESWMMEKDEKLKTVPTLHMQGNTLVKQGQFREAASKYKDAVLLLKTVQSREMPSDMDYINLGRMIIPLELNYCQCMLELEEYYEAIEHTTELLEKHKDCVKGYYKRAKAHAAVWNEKEARRDYNMVANLDVTLASLVHREMKALSERMKEKYWEEKEAYWNMLEREEGHDEEKVEVEVEVEVEAEAEAEATQEDNETLTTERKEEVGEEKRGKEESPSNCAEVHKREVGGKEVTPTGGTGNKEIIPHAPSNTEGKDWQQMLRLVMLLQNESNFLIKDKCFEEASVKLQEAKEYVDFLQNTVDRENEDWESLERVRLPLTLNLSQCMLEMRQYQQVVELNSKLLRRHKNNFKAVYQRARAHAAMCNEDEARRDFNTVERLDPKFKPIIHQEMRKLCENLRVKHASQKKTYWDTMEEKWGPSGSKAKSAAPKKKSVKFSQKAAEDKSEEKTEEKTEEVDQKAENSKSEDNNESSQKPAPAETKAEGDVETQQTADVKAEMQTDTTGLESGEGLDKEKMESVVVQEDGQGAPDNRATGGDRDEVPTCTGKDNVASKISTQDKGKKVKRRSRGKGGQSRTSQGKKATTDKTGHGGNQSQ